MDGKICDDPVKVPFYEIFDTKEEFYKSLEKDAIFAVMEFWNCLKYWKVVNFAFENSVDKMMQLSEWKVFWSNYLRYICNTIVPYIDKKPVVINEELFKVWNDIGNKIAKEKLKILVGEI